MRHSHYNQDPRMHTRKRPFPLSFPLLWLLRGHNDGCSPSSFIIYKSGQHAPASVPCLQSNAHIQPFNAALWFLLGSLRVMESGGIIWESCLEGGDGFVSLGGASLWAICLKVLFQFSGFKALHFMQNEKDVARGSVK